MERKIRVLIVEDSAAVRRALSEIITSDPALEVMATAADPYFAVERISKEVPDVIFLDIEMPRMDGLTFLRKLMAQRPIPVVICSTLTQDGSHVFMAALEAGAVDVVAKPRVDTAQNLHESRVRICDAARAAAMAKIAGRARGRPSSASPAPPSGLKIEAKLNADAILPPMSPDRLRKLGASIPTTAPMIAIGASTGGTEALRDVLEALGPDCPPVTVVQHMPERFTNAFANRLDGTCKVRVSEARDGDELRAGHVLIAPGDRHMMVTRTSTRYSVRVVEGPPVSRHRPSVNVLFRSVSQAAGRNALGILLTGMGDDGASGLLEMRQAGARTIAQDEASCVVFGMPKEAIERGAAMQVLPLAQMADQMVAFGRAPASREKQ